MGVSSGSHSLTNIGTTLAVPASCLLIASASSTPQQNADARKYELTVKQNRQHYAVAPRQLYRLIYDRESMVLVQGSLQTMLQCDAWLTSPT
jgi:hypothetical protein